MPICLSIQSLVVAGHVGHGASAFALAAEGVEVWPLPTVLLSGHAATPGVQGERFTGPQIAALGQGLAAASALPQIDAVLTGYLGSFDVALETAQLLAQIRAAHPHVPILVDPVLGDDGQLYLPPVMIGTYQRDLLPLAMIVTPNVDELAWLTGLPVKTLPQIAAAAQALCAQGPRVVHVTSVPAPRKLGILTATAQGTWLSVAPKTPHKINGAGDFVAALLLAEYLKGTAPQAAAARATAATGALATEAMRLGRDTLPVVAARALWQAQRHYSHSPQAL